jgi:capsid protein
MTVFNGASNHPLLGDWLTWCRSQEYIWASEAPLLADRALSLACNDPFISALVAAHTQAVFGPEGLLHTSLYDDAPMVGGTSDNARKVRRFITALSQRSYLGRDLDAEGTRTRRDLEVALDWMGFVLGDGFAIRIWRGSRSVWRLVLPHRVRNPTGVDLKPGEKVRDGFRLDANDTVIGVYVAGETINGKQEKPQYIPWVAADGTPNVIHRVGYRLPGMLRGVSRLAPMIVMSRQLSGVLESHVAAKRLQAIFAMTVEAETPEDYKKALDNGTGLGPGLEVNSPLSVWVKPPGTTVDFTDTKFNGADLTAYLMICYKVQCAVVQFPVDVVLCQMGEASLSSARAGLDQFDRTAQTEQGAQIAEVTSIIDQVQVSDAIVRGDLDLPLTGLSQVMVGEYLRPPKYSTDRKKDAETMAALIAAGVSESTVFALYSFNWEDQQEIKRAQAEFLAAQGIAPTPSGQAQPTQTPPDSGATPAPEDQPATTQKANVPWWRYALSALRIKDAA